jgi:hypothetical protein
MNRAYEWCMPSVTPDFEKLCQAAYAEGAGMEQRNALWCAVFGLKEWNFIARGEFPNVHPYVCANSTVAGGQYMVKAFTDPDKLRTFAKDNALTDPDGSVRFLSIPVSSFLGSLDEYRRQGVYGIHFNAQGAGFFGPLEKLPAMLTFLEHQGEL